MAYLALTYVNGERSSRIVASKMRVAPLTSTSIPRLELMAAVVGIRLAESLVAPLEVQMQDIIFWSDSMNVLHWIRNASRQFKPFVANRVGDIQRVTTLQPWRHVPTTCNPADLLTRGLPVKHAARQL